ncbi:hypothetical protein E2C01_059420 [Portunus trituberculatus]|uniref:Uncharacterized protein n=1 Tax=Portunus trituberculatus TaxID=210409 RepID=A0A5B7H7I4_PORTR|nr:hypothetical protein [Portunus trituberculatus]
MRKGREQGSEASVECRASLFFTLCPPGACHGLFPPPPCFPPLLLACPRRSPCHTLVCGRCKWTVVLHQVGSVP